jgi:uncharacterized RmlC-like cupin family protein
MGLNKQGSMFLLPPGVCYHSISLSNFFSSVFIRRSEYFGNDVFIPCRMLMPAMNVDYHLKTTVHSIGKYSSIYA